MPSVWCVPLSSPAVGSMLGNSGSGLEGGSLLEDGIIALLRRCKGAGC